MSNSFIWSNQLLPLRAKVQLGAMMEYSILPKAPGLEPHHQMVKCHIQDTCWRWGSYSSAEMQSVYSTAPVDWALLNRFVLLIVQCKAKNKTTMLHFNWINSCKVSCWVFCSRITLSADQCHMVKHHQVNIKRKTKQYNTN